eukprot:gene24739-31116_t
MPHQIIKKTISQVYSEFSAKEADELEQNEVNSSAFFVSREIILLRSKYEDHNPSHYNAYQRLRVPGVVAVSAYGTASLEDILTGTATEKPISSTQSQSNLSGLSNSQWSEEDLLEEARVLEALYGGDNAAKHYLQPSFVTFYPPLMDFTHETEELKWRDIGDDLDLLCDEDFRDRVMKVAMDHGYVPETEAPVSPVNGANGSKTATVTPVATASVNSKTGPTRVTPPPGIKSSTPSPPTGILSASNSSTNLSSAITSTSKLTPVSIPALIRTTTGGSVAVSAPSTESLNDELNTLLRVAIAGGLNPKQLTRVIALVKSQGAPAFISVLTPEKLPSLVENNWSLAVQCVIQIVSSSSVNVEAYLRVLESGERSFHSIE